MARQQNITDSTLIAPCGLNCRLCRAYQRAKKACPGCRGDDRFKSKASITCRIKTCERRKKKGFKYCCDCDEFPCVFLINLDNRYTSNYSLSVIENLKDIKSVGVRKFVENENEQWSCPECGMMLCMHRSNCPSCEFTWRK